MNQENTPVSPIMPGAWLGMVGGGQLGRMFCFAAQAMGYRVAVLDPDIVLRADFGPGAALSRLARGAGNVAKGAIAFSGFAGAVQLARINGSWGFVASLHGAPYSVASFSVRDGRIVQQGPIAELEDRPADRFVAEFLAAEKAL